MKTVRLYIEHKKSPVRYFPADIQNNGLEFRLEDFGVEDEEYNIEDFYLGLECEGMTEAEVNRANGLLALHFNGNWEKAKFMEGGEG